MPAVTMPASTMSSSRQNFLCAGIINAILDMNNAILE